MRQFLLEVVCILEADAYRCLGLIHNTPHKTSHNSTPVNSVKEQTPTKEMALCQAASIRVAPGRWYLGLPVTNGQVLNSMGVLVAHLFLYCTKMLQCKVLLCYWHGAEGCCKALANVYLQSTGLLTWCQQIIFWHCKWKFCGHVSGKWTRYSTIHIKEISHWPPP